MTGFALGVEQPGDLVYITGNTLWYEGTDEVSKKYSPKVVLMFTGLIF